MTSVLAYPTSLSYHDKTFTKFPPTTFVKERSAIAPYVFPIMSDDTSGSFVVVKMPFHLSSFAASISAPFTSSIFVFFFVIKVMSAIEPEITGTRKAMPSNFPVKIPL